MNETSSTFELLEPTSPEALVPDAWVEPWMIVVAALLVIGMLAVLIFRAKKSVTVDPLAVREGARAEAVQALMKIGAVEPREAAVQSSLILRRYLSAAAGDPALFETHEEYLSRHEALKDFSDEARGSAGIGFSRLAAMKYSADGKDMETVQVIDGSRALLEVLHRGFRA